VLASDAECRNLVRRLPNLGMSLCTQAALQDSGARSVKGLPLYTRDIRPEAPKQRVLVIGAIHGDELSSASVAFHWIALAQDPLITLPQPIHWRFIPVLNPDGLFHQPPRRMNHNGVDLNRNFPTPNWGARRRHLLEPARAQGPRVAGPVPARCRSLRPNSYTHRWSTSNPI
jgi:protein MpaA